MSDDPTLPDDIRPQDVPTISDGMRPGATAPWPQERTLDPGLGTHEPYPPEPYPAEPYPPTLEAPPQPRGRGCLKAALILSAVIVLLVVGFIALAIVLLGKAIDDQEAERELSATDVRILDCGTNPTGLMSATVEVTNRSSKRSNYTIEIAFVSPDGAQQFATAPLFVSALEPGQVTQRQPTALERAPADHDCRIIRVDRSSAEG